MDSLPKNDERRSGLRLPSGGGLHGKEQKDAERKLWRNHKRSPSDATRNALIEHHWGIIHLVAIRFHKKFNTGGKYEIDEIVSEACVVAIRCINSFDYRRGFQFSTYFYNAFFRNTIRELLFDGLNKGRKRRQKIVTIGESEKSIEDDTFREPETIEHETGRTVDELFSVLDEQQRSVLSQRFLEGKTLKEIGDAAGLSKERIRQVETQALKAIRKSLGLELPGGDR